MFGNIYNTTWFGRPQYLGYGSEYYPLSNLVENGDFSDGINGWTLTSGWTDNGDNVLRSGVSTNSWFGKAFDVENGQEYFISYDRTYISGDGQTNSFSYFDNNATRTTRLNYDSTVVETVTVTDTFTPNYSSDLALRIYGINDFNGTMDYIIIRKVVV